MITSFDSWHLSTAFADHLWDGKWTFGSPIGPCVLGLLRLKVGPWGIDPTPWTRSSEAALQPQEVILPQVLAQGLTQKPVKNLAAYLSRRT